ncbi:2-deoxyglucose-6-phosphate phosphatase, putative [Entamoeba invadens IP1]|uniref:2-deoxyglucose-6-phosphate phosphatase, putative n=1 Tax=Entamoeba invadens IP1 TaxID=370355 RepID=A0A0A1U085_ENTIV|nr:2-deoxyglucose-6-phosphate phosphatase, putative [Entamoeba invadens IP1]ELP84303.1 2-deoxyglucose-6-phosphate phosphatase, putative [Entamoeba invadens IP1]|eukprot:XP_004183649.1 2-deoxyglucose-6-phosphate phosphatase, putative [Entamoeba invadens IP1]
MSERYAIFDLDGTLLDTEIMYTIATQQYLDEYSPGSKFDYEMKKQMMGRLIEPATRALLERYHITDTISHAVQYKIDHLNSLWSQVKPLPGAIRILQYFKKHSIPIALATSTTKEVFDNKMEANKDMLKYFDAIVLGDNPAVKASKPKPDIFLHAAKLLGCTDMKKAIVFEDAVLGVQAGLASGALTIAIPEEENADDPVFNTADCMLKSLNEFKPSQFGLPDDF